MMSVFQKVVDPVHGDCMRACAASLTDTPIEQVPDFGNLRERGRQWFQAWEDFFAGAGWTIERQFFSLPGEAGQRAAVEAMKHFGEEFVIVWGPSANEEGVGHSVIYRDGELFHDPHPGGKGLLKIESFWIIRPPRR